MTVKQLEQRLAVLRASGEINDQTTVFLRQTNDEYPNSLVQNVGFRKLKFDPGDDGPPAIDDCLVITDDF
jgi:hypothetical protein